MCKEYASAAELSLPSTSTANKNIVAKNVSEKCGIKTAKVKAIRYIGKQDVYNMEVSRYHNFSVNGGLIVHNSIDSLRYAINDEMKYGKDYIDDSIIDDIDQDMGLIEESRWDI